jgi:hypothetical protein
MSARRSGSFETYGATRGQAMRRAATMLDRLARRDQEIMVNVFSPRPPEPGYSAWSVYVDWASVPTGKVVKS